MPVGSGETEGIADGAAAVGLPLGARVVASTVGGNDDIAWLHDGDGWSPETDMRPRETSQL